MSVSSQTNIRDMTRELHARWIHYSLAFVALAASVFSIF
jgi:hypothetical protein